MTPEEMKDTAERHFAEVWKDDVGSAHVHNALYHVGAEICERLDKIDSSLRDLIDMAYLTPEGVTVKPKPDPKTDH